MSKIFSFSGQWSVGHLSHQWFLRNWSDGSGTLATGCSNNQTIGCNGWRPCQSSHEVCKLSTSLCFKNFNQLPWTHRTNCRSQLSEVCCLVKEVNILDSEDSAHLALLARPELGITFTKLHCWTLTDYSKCVFLDADTLVPENFTLAVHLWVSKFIKNSR